MNDGLRSLVRRRRPPVVGPPALPRLDPLDGARLRHAPLTGRPTGVE